MKAKLLAHLENIYPEGVTAKEAALVLGADTGQVFKCLHQMALDHNYPVVRDRDAVSGSQKYFYQPREIQ